MVEFWLPLVRFQVIQNNRSQMFTWLTIFCNWRPTVSSSMRLPTWTRHPYVSWVVTVLSNAQCSKIPTKRSCYILSSANCSLRKPCETCETLQNKKPICETLRKLYLRKLAKTCVCETLRILRNKHKTAKLVFAKPCETCTCETCETLFAKLGETQWNANCENRESCENWVALRKLKRSAKICENVCFSQ